MKSRLSGVQIPTAAKLNIDGEFTLDSLAGTSGQVLISQGSGNTPSWTSSPTFTGLSLSGGTSPLTLNGSTGTVGQVLTSAGSGTTPTWSSSYLSTSSSYFAGHHPEGRIMYNAYLTNDFANARLRGSTITVTQNGSPYSVSNTNLDAMFDGTASFWNISPTSGFTFPLVIEFTLPRTLTYGTWVGIGFGNASWRANSVKIEVYSTNSSSWVTVIDTASNTSEDVYAAVTGLTGGNSTGITSIRYTLANPNSTQLRIAHIWGYNFASDMWSTTMMPRAGGSFYAAISTPGITLSGATSPITLNASTGTSGQVLISQGSGNTPAWTSSLNLSSDIFLGGDLKFSSTGTGAPTFTTYSAGVRSIHYDNVGATSVGYTTGIDAGVLWNSIPAQDAGMSFKWYGGTTVLATLTGAGELSTLLGIKSAAGVALPISTANNTTASGAITIQTGTTSSGTGGVTSGAITIATGAGAGTSNASGPITIRTGNGSGSTGPSGNITIDSGVSSGGSSTGTISIGTANASDIILGRPSSGKLSLNNPILSSVSTVGGGGGEGGQINFARVTDGNQYWYIDSFGTSATPSLRFVENATTQIQIDTGGIVNLYGSLKLRAGTATANTAPVYLANGTNLTTPVSGAVEYDGTVLYATSKTNPGRALLTQNYYYLSNSSIGIDMSSASLPLSLLTTTTTGITVPAGTTYDYEAMFAIQGTFILTSQTPTITISSLSGTATVAHTTVIETGNNTTGFTTASTLGATRITAGQALTALTAGSRYYIVKMRGTIRVTGSGTAEIAPTIRPNVGSVDNGWTVQPGAMFKLTPIGDGTVTTVGTWA